MQRRAVERARAEADGARIHKERGGRVQAAVETSGRRVLARLAVPELRAGEHVLATDVALALERGARVHLAGPNGAGKTTLLDALARQFDARSPVLYLRQELSADDRGAVARRLRGLPSERRGAVLQLVAALGADPDALLASDQPSPGEARKLLLAEALGSGLEAMLLDEPTNHLDLPSIERLEEMLGAYTGAVVIISHDEAFARALTTVRWQLGDGGLRTE